MKKKLSILFVSLFALGLILLAGYGYVQYRNQKVGRIVVHIERKGAEGFLNKKEIKATILKQDTVTGRPIKSINTRQIEKRIAKNPYVKAVDIYLNLSGNMMVNVMERTPLLRVYNQRNKSCYMDTDGNLFPLSSDFFPRVLPANGYIKAKLIMGKNIHAKMYKNTSLPGLYLLAKKIGANAFLKANISQLFINSKGNMDMVPELGRFIFHLGNSTDMELKLENLEAFCKKVLAHGAWSKYRSINLQYTNQIVCTKK
jgi:cell division protein FtsQ